MLVEKSLKNEIDLEQFISKELPMEQINEGFHLLHEGKRYNSHVTCNKMTFKKIIWRFL